MTNFQAALLFIEVESDRKVLRDQSIDAEAVAETTLGIDFVHDDPVSDVRRVDSHPLTERVTCIRDDFELKFLGLQCAAHDYR